MAGDAFDPEEDKNEDVKGFGSGPAGTPQGGAGVSYQATGGTTPTGGSPGFVNLGQLLALNKGSGADSAATLNQGIADKAAGAEQGVKNAYSGFTNQVDSASNKFDPTGNREATTSALGKTSYQGPQYLGQGDASAGQMRKDVANSQQQVNNLGNQNGVAAEAAKAQSLSPTQAAASAFYMGANNQGFNDTNARFKGLSNMLTDRSNQASAYANQANTNWGANQANWNARKGTLDQLDAKNAQRDHEQQILNARAHDDNVTDQRNGTLRGSEVTAISDQKTAARLGMSYEDWLANGSPLNDSDPNFIKYHANKLMEDNKKRRGAS